MEEPSVSPDSNPRLQTATAPQLVELMRLIADGDLETARTFVRAHEDFVPASEDAWAQYHAMLENLELRAQDEIMTINFLALFPEAPMPRLNLTALLLTRGRVAEARIQIGLVAAHPTPAMNYWTQLSSCIWRCKDWHLLEKTARAAMVYHPTNFRIHLTLGVALFHQRRDRQAIAAFCTALDHAKKNLSQCLDLVKFSDRNKVPEVGAIAFERAVELTIGGSVPENWLKLLEFLKRPYDAARIERFCQVAISANLTDPKILTPLFHYARAEASPAAALAIGLQLQTAAPETPDLAKALAQLQTQSKAGTYSSDIWWTNVKA